MFWKILEEVLEEEGVGLVEPGKEGGGVLEMGVAEEVGTAGIIARDKGVDLVEMQDGMGIVEEQ